MYNKILIAIDDSQLSLNAAKKGLALAQQLDAQVAVLSVVERSEAIGNPNIGSLQDVLDTQQQQTTELLDRLAGDDKNIQKLTPQGNPTDEIIATAEEWNADLIVMGTHGRTGLKHLLVGSVAEHVIRHTTVPVMVVPPNE